MTTKSIEQNAPQNRFDQHQDRLDTQQRAQQAQQETLKASVRDPGQLTAALAAAKQRAAEKRSGKLD